MSDSVAILPKKLFRQLASTVVGIVALAKSLHSVVIFLSSHLFALANSSEAVVPQFGSKYHSFLHHDYHSLACKAVASDSCAHHKSNFISSFLQAQL